MRARAGAVIAIIVSLGGLAARQSPTAWPLEPHAIESPAGSDSAQPQLTVSARGVLLSWIERSGANAALKFSERTASGWTTPRSAIVAGNLFVNWADVPSVLRLDDGTLVAHWLQKSGSSLSAYDVRLSSSKDDGKTWMDPVLPHHDGTPTEHGFASLFQMRGGGLGLVWLDGRAMTADAGHGGHGAGNMALMFGAFDRQWKQTAEAPIDARVCECCPTSAAVTADGPIVAYRNRGDDELRDVYVSRYGNGRWTEPVAAHADGWKIQACPVNGPMLSARGRDVALAWFTVRDNQPHAYAAFSSDAGRTFGTPLRLDEVTATGRVDVELLPDGSALASYIEYGGGQTRFNVRRVDRAGARSSAITIAALEDGRTSGYPRMALHGDELVFAWVERAGVKTKVARLAR